MITVVFQIWIDRRTRRTATFLSTGTGTGKGESTEALNPPPPRPLSVDAGARAFDHPAGWRDAPVVWIADDVLGIGRAEAARVGGYGVGVSTQGASMGPDGKTVIERGPPDEVRSFVSVCGCDADGMRAAVVRREGERAAHGYQRAHADVKKGRRRFVHTLVLTDMTRYATSLVDDPHSPNDRACIVENVARIVICQYTAQFSRLTRVRVGQLGDIKALSRPLRGARPFQLRAWIRRTK